MYLTQRFLDFAEETRLVEEGRWKEGKGGRCGATDTGGGMRALKISFSRRSQEKRRIICPSSSITARCRNSKELQRTFSIFFNDWFTNLICPAVVSCTQKSCPSVCPLWLLVRPRLYRNFMTSNIRSVALLYTLHSTRVCPIFFMDVTYFFNGSCKSS